MVSTIDFVIIGVYIAIVLIIGIWLGHNEKVEGFFVNNRKTKLFLLIFTTISTNVGASSILSTMSAAMSSGISFPLTFLIIQIGGWALLIWLAPRIKAWGDKVNAYTMGDFFNARYSSRTRIVAGIIILISFFLFAAIQFVGVARLAEILLGLDFVLALIITALLTITYTAISGIKGDFYTDAIQFFVMFLSFIFVLIWGFAKVDFVPLMQSLPEGYFNIFNFDGPVFFIGGIVFGFPLLLMAMEMWQRIYAATDGMTARRAMMISGVLKIVVLVISTLIGLMAFVLVPNVDPDAAYFALMKELLPTGLLGLGFASMLALIMSTIDSMLLVGSATLTKDFYIARRSNVSDRQKLRMGRLFTVLFGVMGLLAALLFQDIVRLAITSVQVLGIFIPAVIAGLLWKRATESAAFWSMVIGFIITLALLPWLPNLAALPAIIVSIIIFVTLTLRNKPTPSVVTSP